MLTTGSRPSKSMNSNPLHRILNPFNPWIPVSTPCLWFSLLFRVHLHLIHLWPVTANKSVRHLHPPLKHPQTQIIFLSCLNISALMNPFLHPSTGVDIFPEIYSGHSFHIGAASTVSRKGISTSTTATSTTISVTSIKPIPSYPKPNITIVMMSNMVQWLIDVVLLLD